MVDAEFNEPKVVVWTEYIREICDERGRSGVKLIYWRENIIKSKSLEWEA